MTAKKDSKGRRVTATCFYTFIDKSQIIIGKGKIAAAIRKKAFDSVRIDGLMYKIREAGINSYILNTIDQYLQTRSVYIKPGGNRSESFKLKLNSPKVAFSFQIFESSTLQTYSKKAKVKLKKAQMTPHWFQQVTRWKKRFCISKKLR